MHSVVSASSPLTITLRHILTEEALPISSANTVRLSPSGAAAAVNSLACGPPSSMGERMPLGGTLVITAASTYRPPAAVTARAACCLVAGETEFTSTTNGAPANPPARDCAAASADPAVTDTNTMSAPSARHRRRTARRDVTRLGGTVVCGCGGVKGAQSGDAGGVQVTREDAAHFAEPNDGV